MSSDLIYISVKRWDDPGVRYLHKKSHLDFCKYLPIDYIDPLDWKLRWEDIWARGYPGHIYTYIAIPRRWKDTIQNVLSGYGVQEDGFRYKARKALINLDRIGILHDIPDLESQSNSPYKQMPVIHCPKFDSSCLFDIRNEKITKLGYIKDEHLVSTGTFNVGVGEVAPNYLTWATAFADIANLTGNLTFQQTTAVTETAASIITENLASNIFTCTSSLDHKGDPTSGYITTLGYAHTSAGWFQFQQEGPGTTNISKLYLKGQEGVMGSAPFIYIVSITTAFTLNFFNNLIKGNYTTIAPYQSTGIQLNDVDQGANIYNNKIWDFPRYNANGMGIRIDNCLAASTIFENNSILGCWSNFYINSKAITCRNNISFSPVSGTCWALLTNTIGRNNCSTDTTGEDADFTGGGSGNISSATALNEVVSVTDTDATFLQVRTDATNANDGGVAVSIAGNTAGIEGNVRPRTDGTYSQGASQ